MLQHTGGLQAHAASQGVTLELLTSGAPITTQILVLQVMTHVLYTSSLNRQNAFQWLQPRSQLNPILTVTVKILGLQVRVHALYARSLVWLYGS